MKRTRRHARLAIQKVATLLTMMVFMSSAHAHLMAGQRGTLNLVETTGYLVLSVPVSAFDGLDDDGDGRLSTTEYDRHRDALATTVNARVALLEDGERRSLEGLIMALSLPEDEALETASQLVVLGHFALDGEDGAMALDVDLFGADADERLLSIAVTRKASDQKHTLTLTPERTAQPLFPSAASVFASFAKLGALHILEGPDHLLFLLVVLAGGWGWSLRQLVAVLTTFTLGHATTLAISVLGGVSAPPAVIEPAIAATIVGMALLELWARRTGRRIATSLRLALVFGCALVHGLGLASAFTDMGIDAQSRLSSLAGFNVGIELAQLGVVIVAAGLVLTAARLFGTGTVRVATRGAALAALTLGTVWFVERLVEVV